MGMDQWRRKIDELDERIVGLLAERATCAVRIGEEKRRLGAPLIDRQRERRVLDRVTKLNGGDLTEEQIAKIYTVIMEECARLQLHAAEAPEQGKDQP